MKAPLRSVSVVASVLAAPTGVARADKINVPEAAEQKGSMTMAGTYIGPCGQKK